MANKYGSVNVPGISPSVYETDPIYSADKPLLALKTEVETVQGNLTAHTDRADNPHSVTASQVGAATQANVDSAVTAHNNSGTAHSDIRSSVTNAVTTANAYTDTQVNAAVVGTQRWLPAVQTFAQLPAPPSTTRSYLCEVVSENNVYQFAQGDTQWRLFSESGNFVPNNRTVTAGTGLQGGGDLSADRSLSLTNVGTAGTYRSITTDAQGRVTAGTNPTTLSGYGITDAAPLSHVSSRGTAQHALAGGTDTTAGFSQANFTAVEKTKLGTVAENATANTGTVTNVTSTDTSLITVANNTTTPAITHVNNPAVRHVTDEQIIKWNESGGGGDGTAILPTAYDIDIKRATVLTFANEGAYPFTPSPPITATSHPFSWNGGFAEYHVLGDDRILIRYRTGMFVARVDFEAGTVRFGNTVTISANATTGSSNGVNLPNHCLVTQSFYDNPERAVVVCWERLTTGAGRISSWRIEGETVTYVNSVATNTPGFSAIDTPPSGFVSTGGRNFLAIYVQNIFTANRLLTYTTDDFGNVSLLSLANGHAIGDTDQPRLGAYAYDKNNPGKILLVCRSFPGGHHTLSFSFMEVTPSGAVTLGATNHNLPYDRLISVGGAPMYSPGGGLFNAGYETFFLIGRSTPIPTPGVQHPPSAPQFRAARFQIARINAAGNDFDTGPIYNLPIVECDTGHTADSNNIPQWGMSSYTRLGENKFRITGMDIERPTQDAVMLECETDGLELTSVKKYRIFKDLHLQRGNNLFNDARSAAFENPKNPGQFLFMQQHRNTSLDNISFWIGHKVSRQDSADGIAIEDSADGFVKAQISPKIIPDIFNPGDIAQENIGAEHTVVSNGELVPIDETSPHNTLTLAKPKNENDLMWYGAQGYDFLRAVINDLPVNSATGSYTGTGTNTRTITGLPFTPIFVSVFEASGQPVFASTWSQTRITFGLRQFTAMSTTTTDHAFNRNGTVYNWVAFGRSI